MTDNLTICLIYCGVSVLSGLILIGNAVTISKITPRYSISRYIFFAYLFAGLMAIFDCAYALREMHVVCFAVPVSYMLTMLYVMCANLTGFFWICYSEKKQESFFVKTKKIFALFLAPFIILLLIVLSSPLTHLYFYFDEGGHYQRGPLFMLISTLISAYVLQNGVTAIIRSFKKEHYVERKEFRRLFIYSFVYLGIQVVQLALPAIFPYRTVGTLIILNIFLQQRMMELIGVDALTHLNNRYSAERQLATLMSSGSVFEVVMLDLDKFKGINDNFGHVEGDKALQYVAEALKNTVPRNCFIARMGGDEFLITNTDPSFPINNIEDCINENLANMLQKNNSKYKITISAGYALKDSSITSIPDIINLADKKLYERKDEKKERK